MRDWRGRSIGETTTAVANIKVGLLKDNTPASTTYTDQYGRFAFDNVSDGIYTLKASYEINIKNFNYTFQSVQNQPFELTESGTTNQRMENWVKAFESWAKKGV